MYRVNLWVLAKVLVFIENIIVKDALIDEIRWVFDLDGDLYIGKMSLYIFFMRFIDDEL